MYTILQAIWLKSADILGYMVYVAYQSAFESDWTGWDQSPEGDIIACLGYKSPNGIEISSAKKRKKIIW